MAMRPRSFAPILVVMTFIGVMPRSAALPLFGVPLSSAEASAEATSRCAVINCHLAEPNWLSEMAKPLPPDPRGCYEGRPGGDPDPVPPLRFQCFDTQVGERVGYTCEGHDCALAMGDCQGTDLEHLYCGEPWGCAIMQISKCQSGAHCVDCDPWRPPKTTGCYENVDGYAVDSLQTGGWKCDGRQCAKAMVHCEGEDCTAENDKNGGGIAMYMHKVLSPDGYHCVDAPEEKAALMAAKVAYENTIAPQCMPLSSCTVMELGADSPLCQHCPAGSVHATDGSGCVLARDGTKADGTASYTYETAPKCPAGSWSCNALSSITDCTMLPVLNASTCWFPMQSPLGLALDGAVACVGERQEVDSGFCVPNTSTDEGIAAKVIDETGHTHESCSDKCAGIADCVAANFNNGRCTAFKEAGCTSYAITAKDARTLTLFCHRGAPCDEAASSDSRCQAAVVEQCREPPHIFAAVEEPNPLAQPFVPDSYTCGEREMRTGANTKFFYFPGADGVGQTERWYDNCAATFFGADNAHYDWGLLLAQPVACPEGVSADDNFVCGDDGIATPASYLLLLASAASRRLADLVRVPPGNTTADDLSASRAVVAGLRDAIMNKPDLEYHDDVLFAIATLVDMYDQAVSGISTTAGGDLATARLVPPFSNGYYSGVLAGDGGYVSQFKSMVESVRAEASQAAVMGALAAQLKIDGTKLAGEAEVLDAQERMLADELAMTVLPGINASLEGQRRVEGKMQTTLDSLRGAVKAHMIASLFDACFNLLGGVASMASDPFGAVTSAEKAAKAGEAVAKAEQTASGVVRFAKGFQSWVDQGKVVLKVLGGVGSLFSSWGCTCYMKGTDEYAQPYCAAARKVTPIKNPLCDAAGSLASLINVNDFPCDACGKVPDDPTSLDVAQYSDEMRRQVAMLGEGYWEEMVADASVSVDMFLTGAFGGDTAAGYAYEYKDLLHAQAAYGRDFTAMLSRYIEISAELQVISVQRSANVRTNGVIEQAAASSEAFFVQEQWRMQVLSMQVSGMAYAMRKTMQLVCQGLAYQSTEQFFRCAGKEATRGEPNAFSEMCGDVYLGNADKPLEPFLVTPGASYTALGAQIGMYYDKVLATLKYENYDRVQLAVDAKMWSSSTLEKVTLIAKPWVPPGSSSINATQGPPAPFINYPMPVPKPTWDAFVEPSSPTHGKLRFTIDHATFGYLTADFSGMYLRGFLAYFHGGEKSDEKHVIRMKPSAAMQQQYRKWSDGKSETTRVDFVASPSLASAYPVKPFEYTDAKDAAGQPQPCAFGARSLVFTDTTSNLCPPSPLKGAARVVGDEWPAQDRCPDRANPPAYCISDALASGNPADYYAQKPAGTSQFEESPFNLPALLTQWELDVTDSTGTAEGVDLSAVEGVYLELYFQKVSSLNQDTPEVCSV